MLSLFRSPCCIQPAYVREFVSKPPGFPQIVSANHGLAGSTVILGLLSMLNFGGRFRTSRL